MTSQPRPVQLDRIDHVAIPVRDVAFTGATADSSGTLENHRGGTRSVYVKDSAGNRVEIMAAD